MYIVEMDVPGKNTVWLRSTVWVWSRDRAQEYADKATAETAFEKAKKFLAKKSLAGKLLGI
jgi:hypothetical protein